MDAETARKVCDTAQQIFAAGRPDYKALKHKLNAQESPVLVLTEAPNNNVFLVKI